MFAFNHKALLWHPKLAAERLAPQSGSREVGAPKWQQRGWCPKLAAGRLAPQSDSREVGTPSWFCWCSARVLLGSAGVLLGLCWGSAGVLLGFCWGSARVLLVFCKGSAGVLLGFC